MSFQSTHFLRFVVLMTLAFIALTEPWASGSNDAQAVARQPVAGVAVPPPAEDADAHLNGFTTRNGSDKPVDVVVWTAASGSTEVCHSFRLAVRDRRTGETIRKLALTARRPQRVVTVAPGDMLSYDASIEPSRGSTRGARHIADAGSCSVKPRWSLAPAR